MNDETPDATEAEQEASHYEIFGDTPTSYVDIPALIAGFTLGEWELWVTTVGKDRRVPETRAEMWELIIHLRAWKEERENLLP